MTTRPPKRATAPKRKQAANRRKDASPVNGVVPPEEHRFQPGQTGNPHGRPRKMADLQELIRDILAEEMTWKDDFGRTIKMTRAIAMIRMMLTKSPSDRIALLEYAFGKVPDKHEVIDWRSKLIDAIRQNKLTYQDLQSELGNDLATELFESAGIAISQSREVVKAG